MPFTFPFEPLLNMKKNLEELSHMRLSKKVQQLRVEEEEIQRVVGDILKIEQILQEKIGKGMTASEYVLFKTYEEDLARELNIKEESKKRTVNEIEAEQKNLIQLTKERKMFERLKEKQWKRFQYQTEKLEQKNNDEMVTTRYRSLHPNRSEGIQSISEDPPSSFH